MATYHPSITTEQAELIRKAPLFFVASADPALKCGPHEVGPVNVSAKGGVPLHIIGPNRVAYLDYRGSGNETARHCTAGGPITVMISSFEGEDAATVRLFGRATVTPVAESPLADLLLQQPARELKGAARQVIEIEIDNTMTSCGYGVPVMELVRDRRIVDRGRRYKEAVAQPAATPQAAR
ncbi:MAG: pyridoxamine 5-phosphate oxidase-related FMN-binding [Betaproteobacteria bacterium]|nr:pyridoxamine 5-phosphate oxidase-related FMN-binding [Betaproteobacteria bacterium]